VLPCAEVREGLALATPVTWKGEAGREEDEKAVGKG